MSFKPVSDPFHTYTLKQPLSFLGEEVTELALAEPTAMMLVKFNNPVMLNPATGEIDFNYKRGLQILADLSTLPEETLVKMASNDLAALMLVIAPFFVPGY